MSTESIEHLLSFFVGPALVAALVTYFFNSGIERNRARREYLTRVSDGVRDDIRKAVEAGAICFSESDPIKRRLLEVNVLVFDHEVRAGVAHLLTSSDKRVEAELRQVAAALQVFVENLTGGTFQTDAHGSNMELAGRVIASGSLLRRAVVTLRRVQLGDNKPAIDATLTSR